jgi:membrane-associated phospholipid phosphatase
MKFKIVIFFCLIQYFTNAQSGHLDYKMLYHVNHGYTKTGGQIFHAISETPTYVGIGIPVVLYVTSWIKKDKQMRIYSYESASTQLISGVIIIGMKIGFDRERPFNTYSDINKYSTGGSPSFPSGHTAMAFAAATSLSLAYPEWYIIAPSMLYASAVGYSRMYLGVHYFTDVAAGAIIGAGTAFAVHYTSKWIQKKVKAKRENTLGLKL